MDFDLERADIPTIARALSDRFLSSVELTEAYISRIEQLDPHINAVLHHNPTVLETAQQSDHDRAKGLVRGPLHGIPIMIKDNLDTGDSMPTTAGSLALKDHCQSNDAEVVRNLRDAGAVLLGKTNLSEWANFRSTRSSSGWSSLGGQTRNPYALDRSPGGSSSGSGAAVAAGLCAGAIGTETDGSIVSPSAMNSLVGIKPTVGLVSTHGIIPISSSQDTAGPITKTVADAAIILGAIASPSTTAASANGQCFTDYTPHLNPAGLKHKRIGSWRAFLTESDGVATVFDDAISAIQSAGAEVVELHALPSQNAVRVNEITVMSAEFKQGLNTYLSVLPPHFPNNLTELIAFNREHSEEVMAYFQQELLERSDSSYSINDQEYRSARSESLQLVRTNGIDPLFSQHKLDAILVPTTSTPWKIDWVNGDNRSGSSAYLAAVSGYPSITVPAGYVHGLPVGVSFITRPWQEPILIEIAYAFELLTQVRRPPNIKTTIKT